jgi:hypothetical protein
MVSIGRKVMSVGILLGAIGLVRIRMLIGSAQSAHPQEMESLLARRGYSEKPVEASLMIVGYQYAVLRRPFPEIHGTCLERERSALLLWFAIMFIGVVLILAGFAIEVFEARSI